MGLLAVDAGDYRAAMGWVLVTLIIDGVDGTLARLARVREVLPQVNGKTIDYVIDFFTYAILPAYLFYEAVDMAYWPRLLSCFVMLLSAALYYGREGMVSTDGHHFVGFPVLWNMVVYVFVFVVPGWSPMTVHLSVVVLGILHFVPILVPYPSQGGRWWPATLLATVGFLLAAVMNVWLYPEVSPLWRTVCLVTVVYFIVLTGVDTWAGSRER